MENQIEYARAMEEAMRGSDLKPWGATNVLMHQSSYTKLIFLHLTVGYLSPKFGGSGGRIRARL